MTGGAGISNIVIKQHSSIYMYIYTITAITSLQQDVEDWYVFQSIPKPSNAYNTKQCTACNVTYSITQGTRCHIDDIYNESQLKSQYHLQHKPAGNLLEHTGNNHQKGETLHRFS